MGAMVPRSDLISAAQFWFEMAECLDWRCYDPYDLLASPYLRRCPEISTFAARAIVQIGRRSGTAIRRLLRIAPHEEAQVLATFLRSAALLARCGEAWAGRYVEPLMCRLAAKATTAPPGRGWGLDFPVATRFGFRPRRLPNIYQTLVALSALMDAEGLGGSVADVSLLTDGSRFVTKHLATFEYAGQSWLRYWPRSDDPIVNVQALASGVFARLGARLGEHHLLALADRAAATVLGVQRGDGSWPYSADGRATFVDGFHTGFILEGLSEYMRWRPDGLGCETGKAVRAGFRYYKQHLLSANAQPRAFADGPVSLDGQTAAQCVQTLTICAADPLDASVGLRVWESINRRHGPNAARRWPGDGSFPALRWTIAPAALATAHLVRALESPNGAAET